MRKLKLEMQVSLDGFAADADGGTDWMVWNWSDDWAWDKELQQYHLDLTTSSDCILLSRKMAEEGFHQHWERVAANRQNPQCTFAKAIIEMRKVVFSKTLERSLWKNTELAQGELTDAVSRLKKEKGKDVIVYGGPIFASSLINAGLIDEFHLIVNPAVVGNGSSMFGALEKNINLRLVNARPFQCGVAVLEYERSK